ncbi:YncE family protein [Corynebacterium lactis]|nr:hypothetical protein [Corynebacterium lactis]
MSFYSRRRVLHSLVAGVSAGALALSGCSSSVEGSEVKEGMGNASPAPAASPAMTGGLKGKLKKIDENITDAVLAGDQVISKAQGKIFAGPLNNPAAKSVVLKNQCGLLAPGGNTALLPCSDGIHVLSPEGTVAAVVGRGTGYSSAVGLPGGRIIGHRSDSDQVDVFGADGELSETFGASREGSQLVAVPPVGDGPATRLMEVNRPETSVHELKLDETRTGSGLRAGIGVGKAAAGTKYIAAADTKGNQLLVYTMTDIIRLHQAAPVPESPWAVAVDDSRDLIWVASTKVNKLTAYDVSSGTPVRMAEIDTVADPQSLVVAENGAVEVFSATGQGAQLLEPSDIDKAIEDYAAESKQRGDDLAVREPANNLPTGEDNSAPKQGADQQGGQK